MILTIALAALGPGATITYIGEEGPDWWVEIRLPESRYTATLVTDTGTDPGTALAGAVERAVTEFAKEQEGRHEYNELRYTRQSEIRKLRRCVNSPEHDTGGKSDAR